MLTRPAPDRQRGPLPHDAGVERAVLGAVLNHSRIAARVLAIVTSGDFYDQGLASVMTVVGDLVAAGVPVEPVTVAPRLPEGSAWDLGALVGLAIDAPSDGGALDAARTVGRHAAERRAVMVAQQLRQGAEEGRLDDVLPGVLDELAEVASCGRPVADVTAPPTLGAFLAEDLAREDLLVPGLLEARDRVIVTGPEGGGKSTS